MYVGTAVYARTPENRTETRHSPPFAAVVAVLDFFSSSKMDSTSLVNGVGGVLVLPSEKLSGVVMGRVILMSGCGGFGESKSAGGGVTCMERL